MPNKISRKDAQLFYATAWIHLHEPDHSKGRCVSFAAHPDRPYEELFNIQTHHGLLRVYVMHEDHIPARGYSITMRFATSPAIKPEIGAEFYDPATGYWELPLGEGGPHVMLQELAARLDWAQGRAAPAESSEEQLALC